MNIPDPSQGISLAQQQAQGFLALPWTPLPNITISTGFSTTLAALPTRDPFINDANPFDIDQLSRQRFLYVKEDSKGSFSSISTTSSGSSNQHTSIAFGVSVGNEYLNAGVTGSYDQSVLENTAASKSSLRCTYFAGSIRPFTELQLSDDALTLLRDRGLTNFQATYGDYYVSAFVLGAESAALIHSSSLDMNSAENAKIVAEAQFFCFSDEETLVEKSFEQKYSSLRFGLTAFDSLDGQFVEIGTEGDLESGLTLQQTQTLASGYASRVNRLPQRVQEPTQKLEDVLGSNSKKSMVGWAALRAVTESGLVLQILLTPFERLRQVQEVLAASSR